MTINLKNIGIILITLGIAHCWNVGHKFYQQEDDSSTSNKPKWKFKRKSARERANEKWNM